ncbi:MAG TPA: hypothetical protein VM101_06870 [Flavitalea sp.]|nr:hypothetical protein [Flavitalea sp.]
MQNNDFSSVRTIYILRTGEQVSSREEFEKVKDSFEWLDKKVLLTEMLYARSLTNQHSRSIIAVYEEQKSMKLFLNLDADFHLNDLVYTTETA